MKKYHVTLSVAEREELETITTKGKRSARVIQSAYILLNCDLGEQNKAMKDSDVASFLGITERTVENIRKKFVMDGYEIALYGKPSVRVYKKNIDGEIEARIIALSCSQPPEGYARWSLRMLADKAIELNYLDMVSHETIRSVLKKRIETVEEERVDNPTITKQ
jgi:hypothetical protein